MNEQMFPTKKVPLLGLDIHWKKKEEDLGLAKEIKTLAPIEIEASMITRGSVYLFKGVVSTIAELECARCLTKFSLPLKADFNINYEPAIYESDHKETELGREDLDTTYYANDLLPIGEDLREAVLLALPAVPLCSGNCRGLCPKCGQNRNKVNCQCESEHDHNYWQELANLKKKLEEK